MQLKVPGYEATFLQKRFVEDALYFMAQLFVLVFRITVSQQ